MSDTTPKLLVKLRVVDAPKSENIIMNANMNLLAYLITLGNIQSMQSSAAPIENLSVKFGDLHSLKSELLGIPGLDLDQFRETGYYRIGNVGKYLSQNLRDFIYEGIGEPSDEGVIFTIHFNEDRFTVGPNENTLPSDDVKDQLLDFLDNTHARRQRSVVDVLGN